MRWMLCGHIAKPIENLKEGVVLQRVVKEMRTKLKSDFGIKTQQANSRTSSIVIRYIVRSSRKKAHLIKAWVFALSGLMHRTCA